MPEYEIESAKTKDEIYKYVCLKTENYVNTQKLECTANSVADSLFVSRSLSSLYLNELFKEGLVIKIISRPVFYLDRKLLENKLKIRFIKNIFEDVDEFRNFINENKELMSEFSDLIGYSGSLSYCVNQCIMAIKYSNKGLPIILVGNKGTGKKTLAKHIFNYSIKNKILKKDAHFIEIDANNQKDIDNLLDIINNTSENEGVLYVHNSESLTAEQFKRIDEYYKDDINDTRLVNQYIDDFVNTIAINVQLPDLSERPQHEIKSLIKLYFERESKKLNIEMFVSKRYLNTLCDYQFSENIQELKHVIKLSCANALMHRIKDNKLVIKRIDLPENIMDSLEYSDEIQYGEEDRFINIKDIVDDLKDSEEKKHYLQIIEAYQKYLDRTYDVEEMFNKIFDIGNSYYDYLVYSKEYSNKKVKILEAIASKITDSITDKYGIYLSANFSIILSRMIYSEYYNISFRNDSDSASELVSLFEKRFPNEIKIAKEISRMVYKYFDISIDSIRLVLIMTYIHLHNHSIIINNISGIIISHGYSTASSIADATNRLLGKSLFEAIDMPLDTSVEKVVELIKKYIFHHTLGNNLILLVDMGSLENIGSLLGNIPNLNIGIINNISTKVVLSVGSKILNGKRLEDILKESCKEASTSYTLIKNEVKQKAIIFSLENGEIATNRLIDLFNRSLPNNSEIMLISHDFGFGTSNINDDEIFHKYDVLLIFGSIDHNIKNIPLIALEDIITFDSIDILKNALSSIFSEEELNRFSKNLLSNFSLENIIGYLTILNPKILLTMVEESLDNIQKSLNIDFNERATIGLNVHICCMIERLVTKEKIDLSVPDDISENDKKYIGIFDDCFKNIEKHYRIKIPFTEYMYIKRYIYEYIKK